MIAWQRLPELLQGPLRRRVGGNVVMEDSPGAQFHDHKHIKGAGDDEEMQRFVPIEDLFKGRHFDRQIIVLCVSWYTSFKLSLRNLVASIRWQCVPLPR